MANQKLYRFFITFGQRSPFRHGYVEVHVRTALDQYAAYELARNEAFSQFGEKFSFVRYESEITSHKDIFPTGKLGEIIELNM